MIRIIVEGPQGCGKSSIAQIIAKALADSGRVAFIIDDEPDYDRQDQVEISTRNT